MKKMYFFLSGKGHIMNKFNENELEMISGGTLNFGEYEDPFYIGSVFNKCRDCGYKWSTDEKEYVCKRCNKSNIYWD